MSLNMSLLVPLKDMVLDSHNENELVAVASYALGDRPLNLGYSTLGLRRNNSTLS